MRRILEFTLLALMISCGTDNVNTRSDESKVSADPIQAVSGNFYSTQDGAVQIEFEADSLPQGFENWSDEEKDTFADALLERSQERAFALQFTVVITKESIINGLMFASSAREASLERRVARTQNRRAFLGSL